MILLKPVPVLSIGGLTCSLLMRPLVPLEEKRLRMFGTTGHVSRQQYGARGQGQVWIRNDETVFQAQDTGQNHQLQNRDMHASTYALKLTP